MASLKLSSLSLDNNSLDSRTSFSNLKSLTFTSIALFSGTNEVCTLNHFRNFKQIKLSRLDTELLHSSDCNLPISTTGDLENFALDDDSLINEEDTPVRRINIWKKFRDVKKLPKYTKPAKPKPVFRRTRSRYIQGEEKSVLSMETSVDSVVDADFDDFGVDWSLEKCNGVLREFEKRDDRKALRFFEWMRINGRLKQNVTAYNLILRVLSRKLDWGGAEKLITEMVCDSGCQLDCRVFNTVIYACSKRGLLDLGARWFRMMLDCKVQPNVATFGMLMSLYQKGWVVEEAEFTFSHMRSLKIRCQSAYSAMITIYTRMGLYEKAQDVIGLLTEDEVVLNHENWLVLLNSYCQQGKLNDAEQVFCAMSEAGFSPNIVAYNTLITGYGKLSSMDRVEKLVCSLKEAGLEPDETTYRSLIEGWGRAGNYEVAKLYYMKLQSSGFKPNSSNLFTLINLQAKYGDEKGAARTVRDMIMIGCQKSSILSNVLLAYEKANRVCKVPLVVEECLYDHVCKNHTSCAILVTAYAKNELIDNAIEVLQNKHWQDPVFEDNLYHLLICLCKDLNDLGNAVKMFNCMPKSGKPNLNIYCTMIDIYSTMGRFSEAEMLCRELKVSGVELDMVAFSIIVRMYVKSGSLKDACTVLESMDAQKNILPDVYLLRDMLRIYQKCGMNGKLADLYYKMSKNGEIWDEEMYNCVINCCARALPVDELTRLFDEMLQRGYSPNTITFNVILNAYGKSRLFEKARKVFWLAKKRGLVDVISYNTLIAAYGKNKYLKNMSAAVRRMQFDGFSVSLEAYNCMLDVYGKEGEMEKFRSVLQRMKDSNCASDSYTYNIMINIYGEHGWIDEVGDVLMELKEYGIGPDLCSYNTLIKAYGIAGKVEEAVGLIKEMREKGVEPDRVTYTNLIAALRKNDMFLEAVKWSLWMKQMGL